MARVEGSVGIPDVAPQIEGERVQANPEQAGAQVGQALQGAGTAAIDAGKLYGQVAADQANNEYMDSATAIRAHMRSLRGQDAITYLPEAQQQLDNLYKTTKAKLWTTESQLSFDQDSRRTRALISGDIQDYASGQHLDWAKSVNDTGISFWKGQAAVAAQSGDQLLSAMALHHLRTYYGQNADLVFGQATDSGTPQGQAKLQYLNQADAEFAKSQFNAIVDKDPVRAQKILDQNAGVLGSDPDYDRMLREAKTQLVESNITPIVDSHISAALSQAQAASSGQAQAGASNANNLGNVKDATGGFAAPATPVDGAVLAANTLRTGYRGLTLEQIAAKWAPASDHNNPAQWAANVSRVSGISVNGTPNLDDPKQLSAVLHGITVAEKSGADQGKFTPEIINQGVTAALSGQKPTLRAAAWWSGAHLSIPDQLRLNETAFLDGVRKDAKAKFGDQYPDAVERTVTSAQRQYEQRFSQQEQQYTVASHIVQIAMVDNHYISEAQLLRDPQAGPAWEIMKINDPWHAGAIENVFNANARGKAVNYGTDFGSLLDRVLAPRGAPSRLNDPSSTWDYVTPGEDGPLTNTGNTVLAGLMKMRESPKGEANATLLRNFFREAHTLLSRQDPNLGFYDPKGETAYNRFIAGALPMIEVAMAQHEPLSAILAPKGDVYNSIFQYKRKPGQDMADRIQDPNNPMVQAANQTDDQRAQAQADLKARYAKAKTPDEKAAIAQEGIQRGWIAAPQAPKPEVQWPQ